MSNVVKEYKFEKFDASPKVHPNGDDSVLLIKNDRIQLKEEEFLELFESMTIEYNRRVKKYINEKRGVNGKQIFKQPRKGQLDYVVLSDETDR